MQPESTASSSNTTPEDAHKINELFRFTSGPRTARIMLVGEVWGYDEEKAQLPFVGSSGHLLRQMLVASGLRPEEILFTNVVNARPRGNDFTDFLYPTAEKKMKVRDLCIKPIVQDGLDKLNALIAHVRPQLIIGCGNIPLWALTSRATVTTKTGYKLPGGVVKWRGSQLHTDTGIPYLPIIHPSAILREYSWRFPTQHDLTSRAKTFISGEVSWIREKKTTAYWKPTYHEVVGCLSRWIKDLETTPLSLAVDIETWKKRDIVCIGFADELRELCIPFFYFQNEKAVDYFTLEQEQHVVALIRQLLMSPKLSIIGQNYIYDYQFIGRKWNVYTPVTYDTMLMHHLLWPGTPKGLDYLASLYTRHYVYWKDESQDWDGSGGHESLWQYNCKDVRETFDIHLELRNIIKSSNFTSQYEFQLEQWKLAAQMMRRGVRVDKSRLETIRKEVTAAAYELEEWLSAVMPADLRFTAAGGHWFQSPKHSMYIFYSVLGLAPILHKKTKQPTFNYEAFATLRKRAPWLTSIFDRLEEYRSIGVYNSHFLDITLSPDTRLRCNFNIGGTETFRWSSSANAFGEGTNFQNIPKGEEE